MSCSSSLKIIDECIEREKLMSRLKSGVEEIQE
jgi:hypothetical protein